MKELLSSNFDSLPPLLSSHDLVAIGLYGSIDAAYLARLRGNSPDFIKFERKILYPKSGVIEFLEQRLHKGNAVSANCPVASPQDDI